jgi:phage shock protein B
MEEILVPIMICGFLFLGLPWIIFHYITKWKTAATLTNDDEAMLDSMLDTARRLEDRLATVERIIAADNPDFRARAAASDDFTTDRRN